MRKSANKQQSQVQTIEKIVASRNVTKYNGNINSGKAVTNFVVTAWDPPIFIKKTSAWKPAFASSVLTQSSPNREKQYIGQYGGM